LARLLGNFGYDVMVREIHHTGKADAPSGTAIALGNFLKGEMEKKMNLAYERREKRVDEEIDVIGSRIGKIAGHHEVWFTPEESYSERLIVQHDVFTPEIFGLGALMGLRWVIKAQKTGKPPGLYNFYEDVLGMS
jgi:4-hydroxy-tetrahydrodipicolinate reductase